MDMLESDPHALKLERAIILQTGVQIMLNKCFAAEKSVTAYTARLQCGHPGVVSDSDDPSVDARHGGVDATAAARAAADANLRKKCVDRNLDIISGVAGQSIINHNNKFFNYAGSVWAGWRMQDEGKYETCLDLICISQEAAYRLIFKLRIAKLEIFEVCRHDFSAAEVARVADKILTSYNACDTCVDQAFSYVWAYRLRRLGIAMGRRAHNHLCDVLAVLRVTSSNVERKHLIGQELKPKKRGAGPLCSTVGKQVFRHSIRRGGQLLQDLVKRACLPSRSVYTKFHKSLEKRSDRRQAVDSSNASRKRLRATSKTSAKVTAQRGYDIFVSQSCSNADSSDGHVFSKRKLADSKWHSLSKEQKDIFNAAADARNDALRHDEDYVEFCQWCDSAGTRLHNRNRSQLKSRRDRAIQNTVSKMINHAMFGSSIHDFEHGFKPSLVCKNLSRTEVQQKLANIFDYDHIPAVNPKRMPFFQPCSLNNGGFCCKHDGIEVASILTRNLYELGGRHWKSQYPVLLQISDTHDDSESWWWLGKYVGRGSLAFLTAATLTDDGSGERRAEVKALGGSGELSMPITSHKAFIDVLLAWQRTQGDDADFHQLDALQVRRWEFKRDTGATQFRVVLSAECSETLQLSCTKKISVSRNKKDESTGSVSMFDISSSSKPSSGVSVRKSAKSSKALPERSVGKKPGPGHVSDGSDSDGDRDCGAADSFGSDSHISSPCSDPDDSDDAHSEHRSSQSEDGGSAEESQSDDDYSAIDAEPWNSMGVKCWEVVPAKAFAKCEFCKLPIKQTGDSRIRLDYRFKISDKLGDSKRIHPACIGNAPVGLRGRDIKVAKRWMMKPDLDVSVREQLQQCLDMLRA